MKFLVSWTARSGGSGADNEAAVKRTLQLFSKWSPPEGATFHQFLERLDGTGGFAVVETDDPLKVLEGPSKFGPYFEFAVVPVVDIMDGVSVGQEGIDFRESIT
jgi:hypothetical protein